MKKILCTITILFIQLVLFADHDPVKKFAFRGYAGGMMLHTGYMKSDHFQITDTEGKHHSHRIKGMPFGIGGTVKFQFGRHFRIGMEGYTTRIVYDQSGSTFRQGWGGILADGLWTFGKWTPFAGVCFGGGKVTDLLFHSTPSKKYIADAQTAYQQYSVLLLNPFLGMEFAVTSKLKLIFKAEYQLSLKKRMPDQPAMIRFYVGVLFNRIKQD